MTVSSVSRWLSSRVLRKSIFNRNQAWTSWVGESLAGKCSKRCQEECFSKSIGRTSSSGIVTLAREECIQDYEANQSGSRTY